MLKWSLFIAKYQRQFFSKSTINDFIWINYTIVSTSQEINNQLNKFMCIIYLIIHHNYVKTNQLQGVQFCFCQIRLEYEFWPYLHVT